MPRTPIQDRYTQLVAAGKLSKQRAYQLRHQSKGLCVKCDHPAITGSHCLAHAVYERERQRRKLNCVDEHDSKSRRLEKSHRPPNLDLLPPA